MIEHDLGDLPDFETRVLVGQALTDNQRWTMTAWLVGRWPEAFCDAVAAAMGTDASLARYNARVDAAVWLPEVPVEPTD